MPDARKNTAAKPYPDFPLFAHRNGSWKAKIDARQVSFGPVGDTADPDGFRDRWQAALKRYHAYMEARANGQRIAADPFDAELKALVNAHLADSHDRAETGRLDVRTFAQKREALTDYTRAIGGTRKIRELEADPEPIRRHVAALRKRLGIHAYNRAMQSLNAFWNWCAEPRNGQLNRPFRWIGLHELRGVREVRRQQRADRAEGVVRSWSVPEILAMVRHAEQPLRSAILLGYFAAYGNSDVAELPKSALTVYEKPQTIHFHGRLDTIPAGYGMLYFPRPKTEMDRYAIVPPLVVESLSEMASAHPKATAATRLLMFRTREGSPLLTNHVRRDDAGLIKDVTVTDNLAQQFARLIARLGTCPDHGIVARQAYLRGDDRGRKICPTCRQPLGKIAKRGFYCLRHTATTFASSSGASSDARNLFEGHSTGSVRQAFYLDPNEMHDLLLITRELCSRLSIDDPSKPITRMTELFGIDPAPAPAQATSAA